jgi:two-component system, chemotaxis family, protein-glutamate methylesterase/glutaminase
LKSLERKKLILIGASTGGPAGIERIVSSLPPAFHAKVVIAQHMGEDFVPSFAKRLQVISSGHTVNVTREGLALCDADIFVVNGCCQLSLDQNGGVFTAISEKPTFNPDINMLFTSAAEFTKIYDILAIILTGIGDDGTKGCMALDIKGVRCIAESESSAVVYGMPARVKEYVPRALQKDIDAIIEEIVSFGVSNV